MVEELSSDDKIRLASNLILLAPPGELTEVFNGVRVLLDDDALLQNHVTTILNRYHKDQFQQAKSSSDDGDKQIKTLITEFNDLGGGRYFDPRNQLSFLFDHLKRNVSEVNAEGSYKVNTPPASVEHMRVELQSKLDQYISQHFYSGSGSGGVFYVASSDGGHKLIVCIEAHHVKKFIAGRWRSEWTINLAENPTTQPANVKGNLRIQTHLYEEGNVQLVSKKERQFTVESTKDAADFAVSVIGKIKKADEEYQRSVTTNFERLPNTTFKHLRRQLPLTKARLDWDKMSSYQIGNEITNAAGS